MSNRDDDKREYLRLAMVPSCAVDDSAITPELLAYLVAFCSYASKRNDGRCWVTQSKVAGRMGVSRQAVSKAALRLAELGYMEVSPFWSESAGDGKTGLQLSNTYWINLNMTVPPERDRSNQPRKRAGIGGRKPATPAVAPGATPAVAPGATPAVAPGATPAVAQNLEREYGKGIRKGRAASAAVISPQQNGEHRPPEPEADPPHLRGAPPADGDGEPMTRQQFMAQFREEYRARNGIEPRPSVQELAYNRYRHGLEPVL